MLIVKIGDAPITDEVITLGLSTPSGTEKVISISKIRRHAVLGQFANGHQSISKQADGKFKSAFHLPLSDFGAVELGTGTFLQLDLGGLDAGAQYAVYGIECPIVARAYNEYNTETVPDGEPQARAFSVRQGLKGIALSNNGALSSVRISYNSGSEITLLPEELDSIMRQTNDISFAPDLLIEGDSINQTVLGGGTELWYLTGDIKSFEVSTTGAADLTVIQLYRRGY